MSTQNKLTVNGSLITNVKSPSWINLEQLAKKPWSLLELFSTDDVINSRVAEFSIRSMGMYFDYSKQLVNKEVMTAMLSLAEECNLHIKISELLAGQKVNNSENRSALHTALRLPKHSVLTIDGTDVVNEVHQSLEQAEYMVNRIRNGIWRGYSGKAITDVVNLGVGGSDLGPLMVSSALDEWADTDIRVHFVSNMDGSQLDSLLKKLNPETSLFIISSKSFGTVDTLSNAKTALTWLCQYASKSVVLRRHFIGISANLDKVNSWGIHPNNQLKFWEWVGGRFSLWSVIGLAIAIRIGMDNFRELLAGAHMMDEHFATADFTQNLPVIMGLIAVWNSTFLKINAHTVLPYDGRLKYLPSYLTQLEMESNGKSVTKDGQPVGFDTCPILWGEIGSNAQHAFYQLLHQGTQKVSCDFIACVQRYEKSDNHNQALQQQHKISLANCLAQSRVLAFGNQASHSDKEKNAITPPLSEMDKFKNYHGNQPSTTILLDKLTPKVLGSLIALYEHKVYVMASIWNINPFDQWGVEMGKKVANEVYAEFGNTDETDLKSLPFDTSTNQLLRHIAKTEINSTDNTKDKQ